MLSNEMTGTMDFRVPRKAVGVREFRDETGVILFTPRTNLEFHLSGPSMLLWDCLEMNTETLHIKRLISIALEECSVPVTTDFSTKIDRLLCEMHKSGLIELE